MGIVHAAFANNVRHRATHELAGAQLALGLGFHEFLLGRLDASGVQPGRIEFAKGGCVRRPALLCKGDAANG